MDRQPLDSGAIAPEDPASQSADGQVSGPLGMLGHLWRQYPLLFWSGIWTLMLVLAAIAMSGLLNPDLSQPLPLKVSDHPIANDDPEAMPLPVLPDPQVSTGIPNQIPPNSQESARRADSPLWLFLMLAATCGMGCVALSVRFQGSRTTSRQRLQRLEVLTQSLPESPEAVSVPLPPQTQALQRWVSPTPDAIASTDSPNSVSNVPPVALPASQRPAFEMPQQSRLRDLDRHAPGLAELLDIQRRRDGKGKAEGRRQEE